MRRVASPGRLAGWWVGTLLAAGVARAEDWPQWLGPERDGVWRETGIVERFPAGGPKVAWRAPVGGGYSGPAVSGGKVYVTDRVLAPGASNPDDPFRKAATAGQERVLCLDEQTGKLLWQHAHDCVYRISYPCGPRATPVVHGGKVYTLGAMGDLHCLDANSGNVVWSTNFPRDFKAPVPVWGFAAHPLVEGDKLICLVGGEGSVAVAFHKDTGAVLWKALSLVNSELGYCPPVIFKAGGVRQLIIWHPEAVNGLDPETGKVYWSQPFQAKANMSIATPRLAGNQLFVSCFYNGSMLLQLADDHPAASLVWKGKGRNEFSNGTDGLHTVMSTPFIRDGYVYGTCSYGQLRCLRLADGKRIWSDLRATTSGMPNEERWGHAFLVPHGNRCFLFNEKGDLIIARLTPEGYEEIDRAHLLEPTGKALQRRVVWSHPAFANKAIIARNDNEIIRVLLAAQ
jgi:outer membrane protein assembly factor BamB